jgi:hypothetical protein
MATIEQRVSHLEGGFEHLATKADVAELKAELKAEIAQSESRVIKWMIGLMVASIAVASTVALFIQRLIG